MGIQGSVLSTAITSGTAQSITLPASGLTIIGFNCQKNTIGGYVSVPLDSSRSALIPINTHRGVTTTDVSVAQNMPDIMWHVHWVVPGISLNFTPTGLSSGIAFFYYGTPFPDSTPLDAFAGIAVSVTTSTSLSFTFPGGPVRLTGIIYEAGYNTAETNVNTDFSWNTSSGRSVDINFPTVCTLKIQPLEDADGSPGMKAAQTLTVTAAFDGTHVATGQLIIYYRLGA